MIGRGANKPPRMSLDYFQDSYDSQVTGIHRNACYEAIVKLNIIAQSAILLLWPTVHSC